MESIFYIILYYFIFYMCQVSIFFLFFLFFLFFYLGHQFQYIVIAKLLTFNSGNLSILFISWLGFGNVAFSSSRAWEQKNTNQLRNFFFFYRARKDLLKYCCKSRGTCQNNSFLNVPINLQMRMSVTCV